MNLTNMARRFVTVSAVLLLMGGCASAPPEPESMRDPSVDFAAYASYGWARVAGLDGADEPLRLLDQNIRAAIADEMRRRGYVESAENPDLRLAYETASAEKVESTPVRVGPITDLKELNRIRDRLREAEMDVLVIRVGD